MEEQAARVGPQGDRGALRGVVAAFVADQLGETRWPLPEEALDMLDVVDPGEVGGA